MIVRVLLSLVLLWAWVAPNGKLRLPQRLPRQRTSIPRGATKPICEISMRQRKEVTARIETPRQLRDALASAATQPSGRCLDWHGSEEVRDVDPDSFYRLKSLRR